MMKELPFLLLILSAVWTLIITVLWLVIGWRAMRAHERIAESSNEIRYAIRSYFKK